MASWVAQIFEKWNHIHTWVESFQNIFYSSCPHFYSTWPKPARPSGQDCGAGTFWGGLNGSLCASGTQLGLDIVRIKRYKHTDTPLWKVLCFHRVVNLYRLPNWPSRGSENFRYPQGLQMGKWIFLLTTGPQGGIPERCSCYVTGIQTDRRGNSTGPV